MRKQILIFCELNQINCRGKYSFQSENIIASNSVLPLNMTIKENNEKFKAHTSRQIYYISHQIFHPSNRTLTLTVLTLDISSLHEYAIYAQITAGELSLIGSIALTRDNST